MITRTSTSPAISITGGSYTNGGSGSLTGNLTYYSTAANTGSVSGTITKASGSYSFMDMTALGNTLIAAAGSNTYSGTQTNKTFDFTTIPGTNKVIYVNGPVVNPTFIGSGTLYCSGAVSSLGGFGSSGNPVNIVAKAAITTNNNITIYGSMYTGGRMEPRQDQSQRPGLCRRDHQQFQQRSFLHHLHIHPLVRPPQRWR